MKSNDLNSVVRKLVTQYMNIIVIGVLLLCSAVIRYHLMKHVSSGDLVMDITPWIDGFRKSYEGAFQQGFADYYIPYTILLAIAASFDVPVVYSVGTISCIFDYLTAILIYKILCKHFSEAISSECAALLSVAYLFIPTIALNGAGWKQCDGIYSFFVVACLSCLLNEKIRMAFVMYGIAFSFKQQTIFFAPVLIILYFINKKIKIGYFFYVVLAYFIAGLPAVFLGRPIKEVYSIYLAQANEYHQMTLNYPNIYMIAVTNYEQCHIYAKLLTVSVFVLAFWYICKRIKTMTNRSIVVLAIWCVWTCCMFLPAMHQRYDYLVAVLLVICVPIVYHEMPLFAITSAVLFYIGNTITYSYSLFGDDYNPIFVMCCNMIAYALFTYILWKCLSKEEMNGNALICDR